MSETLSAKSKERIVKWADMQSGEVATLINQGAIRETNQRQVFEQGIYLKSSPKYNIIDIKHFLPAFNK